MFRWIALDCGATIVGLDVEARATCVDNTRFGGTNCMVSHLLSVYFGLWMSPSAILRKADCRPGFEGGPVEYSCNTQGLWTSTTAPIACSRKEHRLLLILVSCPGPLSNLSSVVNTYQFSLLQSRLQSCDCFSPRAQALRATPPSGSWTRSRPLPAALTTASKTRVKHGTGLVCGEAGRC